MKEFHEVIDESVSETDMPLLPLCHTTTEGYFMNIFQSGFIQCLHDYPKNDQVSNKVKVAYFFYGKPSYLVYEEGENFTDEPPITLIFEPQIIDPQKMNKVLPFDSGAFERYQIKGGFHQDNFSYANPDQKILKTIVKLLYDNNDDYLNDDIKLENLEKYKKQCWSIKEMIGLYKKVQEGKLESGDQVFSIELQFKEEVPFHPKYVVLPYTFFTTDYWDQADFEKDFPHITVEYYGKQEILKKKGKVLKAEEYQRLMREKVIELITSQNAANE